ncbi:putative dipeptidyl peptidase 1 [Monocercomonoides exilis]|uniref:putative dipeptidyl peptidase 1 n=1 Tax=Monocercomonoides exilis TaxID=2049356 RepID=UPI003559F80F|nr:putative dipeptidyl peptidase 1 [Monocercomonoides exilis]|eukprot:MONOS_11179.1-p1 / transcript=MONOS_11179.1 / gene=MONOS_11179 / organism=Monocercomonoides_exilis_PA203 / gene_product=prepro-cathepsin C precursor / transcript_product=prepro-cathepsin C precursor / location=Mono_scaffold00546:39927-41413(+) / protein_length=474 / sequence_SO=supercontig / SO=protein_coding / is_pseudo=false
MIFFSASLLSSIFLLLLLCSSDTPANCKKDDVLGKWKLEIGKFTSETNVHCSKIDKVKTEDTMEIYLAEPNLVTDPSNKAIGTWTMIYVEGFELSIGKYRYFTLFNWTSSEDNTETFDCHNTVQGWVRPDIRNISEIACFTATKMPRNESDPASHHYYKNDYKDFDSLRRRTKKSYETSNSMTIDWSDKNGHNYVSYFIDEGNCKSSYAIAAAGMIESRISIGSNDSLDYSLSVQELISCNDYSQECKGGHAIEIGMYVMDHGLVDQKCLPYYSLNQTDAKCSDRCKYPRATVFVKSYSYVGGFYGRCSVSHMEEALEKGPIVARIDDTVPSFLDYKSGVYKMKDDEKVGRLTRSVLVVGYGQDEKEGPYWKIKNSKGTKWGEGGFARIYKGNNTLGIETAAEQMVPDNDAYLNNKNIVNNPYFWAMIGVSCFCVALIVGVIILLIAISRTRKSVKAANAINEQYSSFQPRYS